MSRHTTSTTTDPAPATTTEVLNRLADHQIANAQTQPVNPTSYRNQVIDTLRRQHGTLIDQTIADRPGVPAATIANLLALDIR